MTDTAPTAAPPSRKKLVVGSLAAVAVAAVALVVFVLPAEYGIDPTGAGKALGLTKLSEPAMNEEQIRGAKRVGVLTLSEQPQQRTDWTDSWEITLRPYESIELKYTLDKGAELDFTWTATGPLYYDMHSHPFDGGDKLTETYSLGTLPQMHGRYVSQFSGLHGWYWQNRTMSDVTLTLKAAGPITESTLFEMGIPRKRELTPPK
ncbi:MAG: hypothetical protein J7493_10810 [Porphyrobacter sp.]|nr:hypothetical protein [Porphyrobacter sp.]